MSMRCGGRCAAPLAPAGGQLWRGEVEWRWASSCCLRREEEEAKAARESVSPSLQPAQSKAAKARAKRGRQKQRRQVQAASTAGAPHDRPPLAEEPPAPPTPNPIALNPADRAAGESAGPTGSAEEQRQLPQPQADVSASGSSDTGSAGEGLARTSTCLPAGTPCAALPAVEAAAAVTAGQLEDADFLQLLEQLGLGGTPAPGEQPAAQLAQPVAPGTAAPPPPYCAAPKPEGSAARPLAAAAAVPTAKPAAQQAGGGCVVCMEAPTETCLLPCGHAGLCLACTKALFQRASDTGGAAACPFCRGQASRPSFLS